MGKRELVLIAAFAVLGVAVYHFTASPPPQGSEGASLSAIWRNLQRGVHGNRASATVDSRQTVPLDDNVAELRMNLPRLSDLTIAGEDREDIAADVRASARGFDQREARAAADAAKLTLTRVGTAIVATVDISAMRALPRNTAIAQLTMTIKVPRRFAVRIEPHFGPLVIGNVASVDVMGTRGDTRIRGIAGTVNLTHSGGLLDLADCGALKLVARNSRGTVRTVARAATVEAVGGGLELSDLPGPLDIDSRSTDVSIDGAGLVHGPLRVNATSGRLQVKGLRTEARIDARNATVDVALGAAAPVTIYSTSDDITITPAASGYSVDAVAVDGHITVADPVLKVVTTGTDQRVAGPVRGGGPALMLRATRGNITVRASGK